MAIHFQYLNFQNSLQYLITNKALIILVIIVDYLNIYAYSIESASKIFCFNQHFSQENFSFLYISPYFYYRKTISKNFSHRVALLVSLMIIFLLQYFIHPKKELGSTFQNKCKKSRLRNLLNYITVNLYELGFFRSLSIMFLDIPFSTSVNLFTNGGDTSELVYHGLAVILFFGVLGVFIMQLNRIYIWMTFYFKYPNNMLVRFPFYQTLSVQYEMLLFVLKILIVLESNIFAANSDIISKSLFLLNIFIVFLIIYAAISSFYGMNYSSLPYSIMSSLNSLRIFLIFFNCACLIWRILLRNESWHIYLIFIFITFCWLFVFCFFYLRTFLIRKFTNCKNYVGVIIFVISNLLNDSWECKNFIKTWIINHLTHCSKSECLICSELKKIYLHYRNVETLSSENRYMSSLCEVGLDSISSKEFICLLYKIEDTEINRNAKGYFTQVYLDLILLAQLLINKDNSHFKLYLSLSVLIEKYKKSQSTGYISSLHNLFYLLELMKEEHKEASSKYEAFQISEKLLSSLKAFINLLHNFFVTEEKTPDNVMQAVNEFSNLKNIKFSLSCLSKTEVDANYQLLITRYLYEISIQESLGGPQSEYDMGGFEDFLEFHFQNDKILLLNFSMARQSLNIIKASHDLLLYLNKSFDMLFPQNFRKDGTRQFLNGLQENNFNENINIFEYVIDDPSQEDKDYVESFRIKYSIYPSLENREMLIYGDYCLRYEDMIIFQQFKGKKEQILYTFSKNVHKILYLSPKEIKVLESKGGYRIKFDDIFSPKNLGLFIFKYKRYYRLLSSIFLSDQFNQLRISKKGVHLRLEKLKALSLEKIVICLCLVQKFVIEGPKSNYVVYFIKGEKAVIEENKQICKTHPNEGNSMINNSNSNANVNVNASYFVINDNGSLNGSSTYSSSKENSGISSKSQKANDKSVNAKKELDTFNKFTWCILLFTILLVLVAFCFLGIEIYYNNSFQALFMLFQNFKYFKRGIENSPLNLIASLCIADINSSNCVETLSDYSKKMQEESVWMKKHNILLSEYFELDFKIKLASIFDRMRQIQTQIYNMNNYEINQETERVTEYCYFESIQNKLVVKKATLPFFQAQQRYVNIMARIIGDPLYKEQPMYILTIDMKFDKEYPISSVRDISQAQRNIYEMILSYPSIHKNLLHTSSTIQKNFRKNLEQMSFLILIFTIAFILLHLLLSLLCLWLLKIFMIVLKGSIDEIIDKFDNPQYRHFIIARFKCLYQLCDLYEDNPNNIIASIARESEIYQRKKRMENSHNFKLKFQANSKILSPKTDFQFEKKFYRNIIRPIIQIVGYLFACFSIYCLMYFEILNEKLKSLNYLVDYSDINSDIDNYLYDNFYLFQIMALTNQSSFSIGEIIFQKENYDYIREGIRGTLASLHRVAKIQSTYPELFPRINQKMNMSCDIYPLINDTIVYIVNKTYKIDFTSYVVDLCKSYDVMKSKDEVIIMEEMAYLMEKLYNQYLQGDYEILLNLSRNKIVYDLYTLILVVNRIIRTYFNEKMLPNEVNEIIGNFNAIIIIYLVMNIVLEIGIFLILNWLVVKKIRKINQKFVYFSGCLGG